MKSIPVHHRTREYQRLLGTNGPNRHKTLTDLELKLAPATAEIITGDKTPKYGGGASPDGFLMNGSMMLGRLRIEGRVKDGVLTIP